MEDNKIDYLLNSKINDYFAKNYDNYVANQELTVTITLNEYRGLVITKAEMDGRIRDYSMKNANLEKRLTDIEKEYEKLREEYTKIIQEKYSEKEQE